MLLSDDELEAYVLISYYLLLLFFHYYVDVFSEWHVVRHFVQTLIVLSNVVWIFHGDMKKFKILLNSASLLLHVVYIVL